MMFLTIDGSSSKQLHQAIEWFAPGFSCLGNRVFYLGRELLLRDGKAVLAEQNPARYEAGGMVDRLVSVRPDLGKHLPDSAWQAINDAATDLVKAHGSEAVKFAPTQFLKHAVALEYIGREFYRINDIEALAQFSSREKYQLILAAQRHCDMACNFANCRWLSGLSTGVKFQLVIDSLKQPEPVNDDTPGHIMFASNHLKTAIEVVAPPVGEDRKASLSIVRKLTDIVEKSLALALCWAADRIEGQFLDGIYHGAADSRGYPERFLPSINNLLYLIAACTYVGEGRDLAELPHYLQTILDNGCCSYYQWFARDIVWHLDNSGSKAEFTRFFHGVTSIADHSSLTRLHQDGVRKSIDQLQPLTQTLVVRLNVAGHKFPLFMAAFEEFIAPLWPSCRRAFTAIIWAMQRKLTGGLQGNKGEFGRAPCSERLSRLFFLVQLCGGFAEPGIDLQACFKAIITCHERSHLFKLVDALTCLMRCNQQTQSMFSFAGIAGGALPLLARLALAPLRHDQLLSDGELKAVCDNLSKGVATEQLKNVVVFNQWLATTNKMRLYLLAGDVSVGQVLLGLTQNMAGILVRLGFIDAALQIAATRGASKEGSDILKRLGLAQCLAGGSVVQILEQVAAGFTRHPSPECQWLWQQRYPHLLPLYVNTIASVAHCQENGDELMGLIGLFITSSRSGQFIATRHDTQNNPHLAKVYRQRPDLASGWSANVGHFSKAITSQLNHGHTLTLTEDPWDLFVSGFEVKSCLSPANASSSGVNRSLMSYVMDGRNAMLVEKNAKGNIVRRAVIRLALAGQWLQPVVMLEKIYGPTSSDDECLFAEAAQEVAFTLRLSLYRAARFSDDSVEPLTMLSGRAPIDYFDSSGGMKTRQTVTITAVPVTLSVPEPELVSTWL